MTNKTTKVVVVGGGFGGLAAARELARHRHDVTLIDRANHHLFQPLLYQVATGGLSPANIAVPLRSLFRRQENVRVLQAEVTGVDLAARRVEAGELSVPYDYLILAAGGRTAYSGNPEWSRYASGLKTLGDATELRKRVFSSLEAAERAPSATLPTFVIAGGGPTGVEMAGAVAELTRHTLTGEFRRIDASLCPVVLVDPGERLLAGYPEKLSKRAEQRLTEMGVTIRLGTKLSDVEHGSATIQSEGTTEKLKPAVTVWAAGVAASELTERIGIGEDALGAGERLRVADDLRVPGEDRVFAIGDMVTLQGEDGKPLPGVAPVAIQQGEHAAEGVRRLIAGRPTEPFRYRDYGSMAVIGRGAAVADIRGWHLSGYPAWLAWLFIHLLQLVGYQNRLLVALQWGWNYATRNRSARLIVDDNPRPADA